MNEDRQAKLEQLSCMMVNEGKCKRTIEIYSSFVKSVMSHFQTSRLLRVSNKDLYAYASSLNSDASRHQMWNALKCYFRLVEGNNTKVGKIIRPKKKEIIPLVYSPSQVKMVAESLGNLKHQTIIYTLYGTGVRKEELINIELSHINRYRNSIRVIGGKGEKDRETFCDDFLLNQITKYWRIFRPKKYLFENDNGSQYSSSSVYNVVKNSFAKFGLKASPHTLRHCFATHLLEADISPRKVQKSMGHKRLETLQIYSGLINIGIVSPLSLLNR